MIKFHEAVLAGLPDPAMRENGVWMDGEMSPHAHKGKSQICIWRSGIRAACTGGKSPTRAHHPDLMNYGIHSLYAVCSSGHQRRSDRELRICNCYIIYTCRIYAAISDRLEIIYH